MANEALRPYSWSTWHHFNAELARTTVPDEPGVYELRTDYEIGRLKGSSPLVTIGSAARSLRKRIYEQRLLNTAKLLNRAERWLIQASHTLEFRYATTGNEEKARYVALTVTG